MEKFIVSQVVGLVSLIMLFNSLQVNEKKNILKFQTLSSFFLSLQYLLLNAMTGFYMNLMCLIRNFIYNKWNNNIPVIYFILISTIMLVLGLIGSVNNAIDFLPTVGVILNTYGLWQKNLKITRFTEFLACSMVLIYNFQYYSITGAIASLIEIAFVIRAIYRFDFKKTI